MDSKLAILTQLITDILQGTKELSHGKETLEWLLRIYPQADWQIQIAAFAHDIERALPNEAYGIPPILNVRQGRYYEYKQDHANRSAAIVAYLMESLEFPQQDIRRVASAISRHETGGDPDSDLVRDADSIRWFAEGYIFYVRAYGIDSAIEKGKWMYKRSAEQTKALIMTLPFDDRIKSHLD